MSVCSRALCVVRGVTWSLRACVRTFCLPGFTCLTRFPRLSEATSPLPLQATPRLTGSLPPAKGPDYMVSERWVLHPTRIPQKPPMGVTKLTSMAGLGKPLASSGTPAQGHGSKMLHSMLLLPLPPPHGNGPFHHLGVPCQHTSRSPPQALSLIHI